ncbi:MAG: hypothetical protein ACPGVC_11225 [Salibacteraceae bacterium]
MSALLDKFQRLFNKKAYYTAQVNFINRLLISVAHTYRYGIFSIKEFQHLQQKVKAIGLPIRILHIDKNGLPNIDGVKTELIEAFQAEKMANSIQKSKLVRHQKYEQAAKFRDAEKQLYDTMYQKIIHEYGLIEGFNYHDNNLLVVVPSYVSSKVAMRRVLQNLGVAGINF